MRKRNMRYAKRLILLGFIIMRLVNSAPYPIEIPFDPVQKIMNKLEIRNSKSKIQKTDSVIQTDFLINAAYE